MCTRFSNRMHVPKIFNHMHVTKICNISMNTGNLLWKETSLLHRHIEIYFIEEFLYILIIRLYY